MKKFNKFYLLILVVIIGSLFISSCSSDKKDDKGSSASNESGEVASKDDEALEEDDKVSEQEDEGQKQEFGELDIVPTMELKENMDYIAFNEEAIDFELLDLDGNTVRLSDYKGQIVFLNFWATWCPPCRAEMPDMDNVHKEYGDKGVVILGVSSTLNELRGGSDSKKAEEQVRKYIDSEGYSFAIPLDADNSVAMEYNNVYPMSGIPTTYMIDREGMIRFVRPGAYQSEEQLKSFIALLDE